MDLLYDSRQERLTGFDCNVKLLKGSLDICRRESPKSGILIEVYKCYLDLLNCSLSVQDYQGQLLRVISRATVRPLNTFVQEKNKDNNKAKVWLLCVLENHHLLCTAFLTAPQE